MDNAATFHNAGTVTLDAAALSRAMAIRDLDQMGLARLSGLSPATVSKALRNRPITGPTFAKIARALAAAPAVDLAGAEHLFAAEPRDRTAAPSPTPGAAISAAMPMEASASGRQAAE